MPTWCFNQNYYLVPWAAAVSAPNYLDLRSGEGSKSRRFLSQYPQKPQSEHQITSKQTATHTTPLRPKEFLDAWFGLGFSTSPSDPVSNDQGNITQSSPRVRNRHSWLEAALSFSYRICSLSSIYFACKMLPWLLSQATYKHVQPPANKSWIPQLHTTLLFACGSFLTPSNQIFQAETCKTSSRNEHSS